jgi:hypothetical protein
MKNDSFTFTVDGCDFNSSHYYHPGMVAKNSTDVLGLSLLDFNLIGYSLFYILELTQAFRLYIQGNTEKVAGNLVPAVCAGSLALIAKADIDARESTPEMHFDAILFTYENLVCQACDLLPDYIC